MMQAVRVGNLVAAVCITVAVFTDLRPVYLKTDLRKSSASICAYWQLFKKNKTNKGKRHRSTKTSQNKDISGVTVTEVMLRRVLSSIGQMKNNNFSLSESSYCRLYTITSH